MRMKNTKRKRGGKMKKLVKVFCLMFVVLSMMVTACGSEEENHDLDRNPVENDEDDWATEEKETQYLELETGYAIEEESTSEEVTEEAESEEPTTEESTTEESTISAPVVQSISARVGGTHYIGEDLSAGDFTVVVTMSDGTEKTNPAGWAADRLSLDEEENQITVTYQGVTTIITVYATERPTEAPTEAPNRSNEMDYILNKNSKVFHYPGCKSVKRMKESNKIYFTGTREEVIGKGYDPCQNCNP